jgi:glycosyltransferase involved in cell wall biosynthesis
VHILQVAESFASGTLGVVAALSNELVERGHRVTVAHGARPETPSDPGSLFDRRVDLVALAWTRRTPYAQIAAGRGLRLLVSERRPDVAHLHSSFAGAVGAAALGRHAARLPLVYTPHGSAVLRSSDGATRSRAYRAAERMIARRVGVIGAVSASEAQAIRGLSGATPVEVIQNGLPELNDGALPAARPRGRLVIAGMGRLGAPRPAAPVARILGALRDVATVVWIGDGTNRRDTELLVEQGIEVTGWLSRERALHRLGAATVCLHWSAWDGQALAILEALARDVVVVASDIPANREILGGSQVCATTGEAIALIERLLKDQDLLERCLDEQRSRRHRWSAERMATNWIGVYEQLVRTGAARSQRSHHVNSPSKTPTIRKTWN